MYIPKNKIVPNLYTDGTKYVIEETNEKYEGYYYRLYNGDLYTGRNANVTPSFKLALIAATGSTSINQNINKAEIALPIDGFIRNEDYLEEAVIDYLVLKNTNFNDLPSIILPTPYYPQPTESDYKLGEFQRYFCVKSNELKYTEVTKEQYKKFKNKDKSVAWQYYIAFTLPWDISGEKEQVYKTNRNIVLITEQNIKRRGLQEFLRKNYLKFYK
tara:strand:- start:35 stop:679 length:645 start_codon:yes stop_codon:yes gene_type:complete